MLRLHQLHLYQFKNHLQRQLAFGHKVVGICGPNGSGKTNLLDAIYWLCFTKSYFAANDSALVAKGLQGLRAEGHFSLQGQPARVATLIRETGKKECTWNGEPYPRLSRHVGRLPAVMIAPDDVDLIIGGSEERRRLLDALLCQLDAQYLTRLMDYNKLLQQRNSLLRQMNDQGLRTHDLLEVLNQQLAHLALPIAQSRHQLLKDFLPQATTHYHTIAGSPDDRVAMAYHTQLASSTDPVAYLQQLAQALLKDLALQRTTFGIHRDDLVLTMNDQPFKQLASQGQRKSLLFALKLTEYEWLESHKGFAPLLLLDDVFEKLDQQRMENLLHEVCVQKQGQVFITDTHRQRLHDALSAIGADFELIELGA